MISFISVVTRVNRKSRMDNHPNEFRSIARLFHEWKEGGHQLHQDHYLQLYCVNIGKIIWCFVGTSFGL